MPTPNQAREAFDRWTAELRGDAVDADPHLRSLMAVYGREDALPALRDFGHAVSGPLDALVRESNRDENLPRLRRWDGQGHRIEQIDFHPAYHDAGRLAYGTGAMSRYATAGREWETLALTYLLSQCGEGGHTCPFACTAGLIKILQRAQHDAPDDARVGGWLARLYDASYDTHHHGAQFLTEVQGGSDVGANALVATLTDDGWRLSGEKWFCSVADAHLFLVTARPEGADGGTRGLMAFVVPRHRPDGSPNGFGLRRTKYKLGTRSMCSAEIDFDGACAYPVGDFKRVVEIVLNTSRLYNAVCSTGMMQRAWREADGWARHREAFGGPIARFPAVARIVARLRVEACAARASTFALAALADQIATADVGSDARDAFRMLVNLNKYWTAHVGTTVVRDAIEVIGGNGAIEEFTVLPRLLRDSIVCEAWEGGHNVLCAQVLKDSQRLGLHRGFFAWLRSRGDSAELDAVEARWARLCALPEPRASAAVRPMIDALRPLVQAHLLRWESAQPGGDPVLSVIADHLRAGHDPSRDPLEDPEFDAQVVAVNAWAPR